jgi:hypothetical protein
MEASELQPPAAHDTESKGSIGNVSVFEASKLHVFAAAKTDLGASILPIAAVKSPYETLCCKIIELLHPTAVRHARTIKPHDHV